MASCEIGERRDREREGAREGGFDLELLLAMEAVEESPRVTDLQRSRGRERWCGMATCLSSGFGLLYWLPIACSFFVTVEALFYAAGYRDTFKSLKRASTLVEDVLSQTIMRLCSSSSIPPSSSSAGS